MHHTTRLFHSSSSDPFTYRLLWPRVAIAAVALVLGMLAAAGAVTPPPTGGYPNQNTAVGTDALFSLGLDATLNTAVGFDALYNDTDGGANTAVGAYSLLSNTTGNANTAFGIYSLQSNTSGFSNTASGDQALFSNTTGSGNTASGAFSLLSNTTGVNNVAIGLHALEKNSTGSSNTAIGTQALFFNTIGIGNTAFGGGALQFNTTGSFNIAIVGLNSNTTGNQNTAIGGASLALNTTGNYNVALGFGAGLNLTTGNYNLDICNDGVAGESKTIRIGTRSTHKATYIAGISGATVAAGVGVVVDTNGHLGTVTSSARYKEAIQPMNRASEAILSLEPVKFRYKKELDPQGIPQYGLVAEDVAKVAPDLVARDDEGKPYSVHYEAVNAMLLNEFLKEHRQVETLRHALTQQEEELRTNAAEQRREIESLKAMLKEQAAQIQKVSAKQQNTPPPQVVAEK